MLRALRDGNGLCAQIVSERVFGDVAMVNARQKVTIYVLSLRVCSLFGPQPHKNRYRDVYQGTMGNTKTHKKRDLDPALAG